MHFDGHVIASGSGSTILPLSEAVARVDVGISRAPAAVELGPRVTCLATLQDLEAALNDGLHEEWKALVAADPLASLFQTPGWCLPWYRWYADAYDPYVITVRIGGALVGLVPMTVERATRRLLFASDSMADYRDIVSLPDHRARVVDALIQAYLDGRFSNPLRVGFIDPASDTPQLIAEACARRGLKYLVGHQPCYRWFPPAGKPSAQKFLNWFKRQGSVTFDVIDGEDAYTNFRNEYYKQHTLRQVQADRPRAFDDHRHTRFFDDLFRSPEFQTHITAFRWNGELLAGHFGFLWRDVVYLGPPSIHLEHEQRSPAVILLSWIIQNAESLGLRGFDLTIGDSDFKKRLSNHCVQLTTVEVFPQRPTYLLRVGRKRAMEIVKATVARVAGPDAWKQRVKPFGERLEYKLARMREEGVRASAVAAASRAVTAVFERRVGHVYAIGPDGVRPIEPRLNPGDAVEFHENRVDDLLLWDGASLTTRSDITHAARIFARSRNAGRTMHTVLINGRLAGWGYSYYPSEPAQLTETPGATLAFEPKAVSLFDFHVIPEFRGRRLYQALLAHILRLRFAEGATRAYITVLASNVPSRAAIERTGFELVARNAYRRFLNRESLQPLPRA